MQTIIFLFVCFFFFMFFLYDYLIIPKSMYIEKQKKIINK